MQHPYHYSVNKTIKHRLLDFSVPILLFLAFFFFYNFGKITPSEMIKTSGLLAITLLGVTLAVGPLSRLIPALDILKALTKLSPKTWKIIQTTSYMALALAVAHFYLMEQVDGVLVLKRLLGQIAFVFAILVIALRILILLLPVKNSNIK